MCRIFKHIKLTLCEAKWLGNVASAVTPEFNALVINKNGFI
jgi:hypothetical protein